MTSCDFLENRSSFKEIYLPYYEDCQSSLKKLEQKFSLILGDIIEVELIEYPVQLVTGNPYTQTRKIKIPGGFLEEEKKLVEGILNSYFFSCGPNAQLAFDSDVKLNDKNIREVLGNNLGYEYVWRYDVRFTGEKTVIYYNSRKKSE